MRGAKCVSLSINVRDLEEINKYVKENGMARSKFLVRAALKEIRNSPQPLTKGWRFFR